MKSKPITVKDIDSYIAQFPEDVQKKLEKIRSTIRKAAPKAEEVISYQMPAFKFHGILVYFAAYNQHIGFYPTSSPMDHFKVEIAAYKQSKGTIQFKLDQNIPFDLITAIVKFRVKENLGKAEKKKISKKK